jgi:hypothetical protein
MEFTEDRSVFLQKIATQLLEQGVSYLGKPQSVSSLAWEPQALKIAETSHIASQ